ncbi:hypothetical protein [Paracoccus tibetensis]|uniref:hypothetical protein n=1 Tax=Paracoccus tibetensis TaxID=336292 RepID=UPI0011133A18|nr:hypothetical protein [Paracoccus tibetensis]
MDTPKGTRPEAYYTAHFTLWLAHLLPDHLRRYIGSASLRLMSGPNSHQERAVAATIGRHSWVLPRSGKMICELSIFRPTGRLTEDVLRGLVASSQQAIHRVEASLNDARPAHHH